MVLNGWLRTESETCVLYKTWVYEEGLEPVVKVGRIEHTQRIISSHNSLKVLRQLTVWCLCLFLRTVILSIQAVHIVMKRFAVTRFTAARLTNTQGNVNDSVDGRR